VKLILIGTLAVFLSGMIVGAYQMLEEDGDNTY